MAITEQEELELLRLKKRKAGVQKLPVAPVTAPEPSVEVQPTEPESLSLGEVGKQAFQNIPGSAAEFAKGIAQTVTAPVQTAETLTKLGVGAIQKALPAPKDDFIISPQGRKINLGGADHRQVASNVIDFYSERFGGIENVKRTIAKDPVGALADATALLTGGGSAISKAGKLGKIGALTKAGEIAKTVGKVAEPLSIPIKAAKAVTKAGGKGVGLLFGISTGTTGRGISEAFDLAKRGGPNAKLAVRAMRGEVSQKNILSSARDALYDMRSSRADNYLQQLDSIRDLPTRLDLTPFRKKLSDLMAPKKFNIKTKNGKLDFSRSTITAKADQVAMKQLIDKVQDWGSQAEDLTPQGVDLLKRVIDNFYSDNKDTRAFVGGLRASVSDLLGDQVKGYKKMTGDYAKATEIIDDINNSLSLKSKNADTTINKLTTALTKNSDFKKALVDNLDSFTGGELKSKIIGGAFAPALPTGILGRTLGTIEALALFKSLDPSFLAIMAASSPRVVGEFTMALGNSLGKVQKVSPVFGPLARQAAFQAGRAKEVGEGPDSSQEQSIAPTQENRLGRRLNEVKFR